MIRIPEVLFPERVSILFFSELGLSFACFFLSAYFYAPDAAVHQGGLARIIVAAFSVVLGTYLNGLYRDLKWGSRVSLVLHLFSVFGIALLIQGLISYADIGLDLPRIAMLTGAAVNFTIMAMWRIAYGRLLKRVFAPDGVLFMGAGDLARDIAAHMAARPELGFKVLGFLSDDRERFERADGLHFMGPIAALESVLETARPKLLVVDEEDIPGFLPVAALRRARQRGITVQDAGSAYEVVGGRVCSRTLRPSQILFAGDLAQRPGSLALQSVYTNIVALAAYVAALPFLALAVAAIRLSSRGPALLTEQYAGFNGIPFSASRLRCAAYGDATRTTRVGAAIRRLHAEHLPRVINLVRGEIALVGPEPQRVEFAEQLSALIPLYRQRYVVKPGLIGWTQIQDAPGSVTDPLRDLEYDLYYTKHFSLPLDAYILLHTIRAILPFQERQIVGK